MFVFILLIVVTAFSLAYAAINNLTIDIRLPESIRSATAEEVSEETDDPEKDTVSQVQFKLPASIQFIEEDAFAGTAFEQASKVTARQETTNDNLQDNPVRMPRFLFGSLLSEHSVTTGTFTLPASLEMIGEEAFEGIATSKIQLPETLTAIGDRAFANARNLRHVYIPASVKTIGRNAFDGTRQLTITGASGSYARTWARENGIPFSPITVMYADAGAQPAGSVFLRDTESSNAIFDDDVLTSQGDRPTRRHHDELNASKYQGYVAFHILGRAPPAAG